MPIKLIPELAALMGADELDDNLEPVKPKADKPKATKFVSSVLDAEVKRQTQPAIPDPSKYETTMLGDAARAAGRGVAKGYGKAVEGATKVFEAGLQMDQPLVGPVSPRMAVRGATRALDAVDALRGGATKAAFEFADTMDEKGKLAAAGGALKAGAKAVKQTVVDEVPQPGFGEEMQKRGAAMPGWQGLLADVALDPTNVIPGKVFTAALPFVVGKAASFTDDAVRVANATSRAAGAVGKRAIVPRIVDAMFKPGEVKILDFGAGRDAQHALALREKGHAITPYDFGENVKEGLHDPDALTKQHDVVYASNVLNTQSSPEMLRDTVGQLYGATAPGGKVIVNLPASPRKFEGLNADLLKQTLEEAGYTDITRIHGSKSEPVLMAVRPRLGRAYPEGTTVYHGTTKPFAGPLDISKADNEALFGPGEYYTENNVGPRATADGYAGRETTSIRADRISDDVRDIQSKWTASVGDEVRLGEQGGGRLAGVKNVGDRRVVTLEMSDGRTRVIEFDNRVDPAGRPMTDKDGYVAAWENGKRLKGDDYPDILKETYPTGAHVRKAKLGIQSAFDIDANINPVEARRILSEAALQEKIDDLGRAGMGVDFSEAELAVLRKGADAKADNIIKIEGVTDKLTNEVLYSILTNHFGYVNGGGKAFVNRSLLRAGYDGITHIGGGRTGNAAHRVWITLKPGLAKAPWGTEVGAVNPMLAADIAGAGVGAAIGGATDEDNRLRGALLGAAVGGAGAHLLARAVNPELRAARAAEAAADAAKVAEDTDELVREGLIRGVPGDKIPGDVARVALGEPPGTPSATRYAEGTLKRYEDEARTTVYLRDTVGIKDPNERHVVNKLLENGGNYYEHRRMQKAADGSPISRSWDQAEADSWNLRMKNALPRGTALNDSEMMAVERQLQGLVERATDIDRDMQAAQIAFENGDTAMSQLLQRKWGVQSQAALDILADQAMQESMVALRSVMGARSEAGRTLNALKRSVKARKVATSDVEFIKRAEALGDEGREIRKHLRDLGTPEQRYTYLRNRAKATEADIFKWYYISSLLSGPKTHARNLVSNAVKLASMDGGLVVNDLGRVATGRMSVKDFTNDIAQMMHGQRVGLVQGWKEAKKVFHRGFTDADALAFAEKPPEIKVSDLFGRGDSERATKYLNVISRFLEASDTFARTVAFSGALHAGAYRRASKLVKAGKLKPSQFAQHVDEIIRDPAVVAPDVFKEATDFAKEAVYRQDAGRVLQKLTGVAHDVDKAMGGAVYGTLDRIKNKPLRVAAKIVASPIANPATLVMPFIKTPANVFKAQARWMGRGFFTGAKRAKEGQDLLAAVHRGEALIGVTTLAALGAYSLASDRPLVTGVGPSSPGLADDPAKGLDEYYASQRPNSIRLPFTDEWIDYRALGPASGVLSLVGNFSDAYRMQGNKVNFGAVADTAARQARSMLSNSFLTGAMGVMSAFEDRTGVSANRTFGRIAAGLMPASGMLRTARQATDPNLRDTRSESLGGSVVNNVKNILPGASQTVRPRVGYAGEELKTGAGIVSRIVSPFDMTNRPEDKIRKELAKLGKSAYLVKPDDQIKDELGNPMDLTTLQRADLQKVVGVAQYKAAEKLLASPSFREAPPALRAQVLRKFMAQARRMAKDKYRADLRSSSTARPQ